jgi:transcriptional regulator GlxA family with amidase domain
MPDLLEFDGISVVNYRVGVNDNIPSIPAMRRNIDFLIYPDFQLLDVAGPIAAFEVAERYCPGTYALRIIGTSTGLVPSSSGIGLPALRCGRPGSIDTLVISGGDGSRAAAESPTLRRFVRACARSVRRLTTVCSGTYVLAAAGLLDGKRATTHWSRSSDFSRRFPKVLLDSDRIFIKDGRIWSSAGVTAGIDLALALITEDLGERIARQVAQQLVVYFRRPGGQSQFSALLQMEPADGQFAALLDHVRSHLSARLAVDDLARHCRMSPRHFARRFQAELGIGPAKAVERLRVETAQAALESGIRSTQWIARSCGFGNTERMRRSFLRVVGVAPSNLKRAARTSAPAADRGRRAATGVQSAETARP